MMPLRFYLIRHGETEWTFSGQHTGPADIPLTTRGEGAGPVVGQRLRNISFGHVLTSPLQRAQQTCALAGLGPVPVIEPDLAEWDNGNDEGRTRAEILASRQGSLSILCYEHDRSDQPAISLWNSATHEDLGDNPNRSAGETRPMNQRAIERWENDSGEVPRATQKKRA